MTTEYKINKLKRCVESLRSEIAETTNTIEILRQKSLMVSDPSYMNSVIDDLQNHVRLMEDEMIGELEILSRLKAI